MNISQNIQKWGNSAAIRIPKKVIDEANLELGEPLNFSVKGRSVILTPLQKKNKVSLEMLLHNVTPKDIGGEYDWGPAIGKELW